LTQLQSLNLHNNPIKNFSFLELEGLETLKYLHLGNTNIQIQDVAFIKNLKKLQALDLRANIIENDFSFLNDLMQLKVLNLSDNHIQDISSFPYIQNLEIVYLQRNEISEISAKFLNKLPNLKELYLQGNPIENLPKEIFDIEENCLEKMQVFLKKNYVITNKSNLKHIKIENSNFREILVIESQIEFLELLNLPFLSELIISKSSIEKLKVFNVNPNCQIIFSETNVFHLDLSNTQLKYFPTDWLYDLTNLRELYLKGNPIENLPKEVFDFEENCLEKMKDYFFNKPKLKPVIFLAFANDREDNARYLRNLTRELHEIKEALKPIQNRFEIIHYQGITLKILFEKFEEYKDRIAIFHFGGHADSYQLLLQSDDGGNQVALNKGLVQFFATFKESLKLVFFNGCASGNLANDLVNAGLLTAIGTNNDINDDVATRLAARFYKVLAIEHTFTLTKVWEQAVGEIETFYNLKADTIGLYRKGEEKFTWEIHNKGNLRLSQIILSGQTQSEGQVNKDNKSTISDELIKNQPLPPLIIPITEDLNIEMVYVEGGTFEMGYQKDRDGEDNDYMERSKPLHQVILDSFYIGKFQVTQEQYHAIMGTNPSYFKGKKLPVERVSWNDAQEFIKKLNDKTGKKFRLPTEAEWEYAARGGDQSKSFMYSGSNNLGKVAWYKDNSDNKTHPVGTKTPNELDLYDMSGNVWEWCSDLYDTFTNEPQTNPKGTGKKGSSRENRGGSWFSTISRLRIARRSHRNHLISDRDVGFRLAMDL
jgi:formylglycine-generating enzyme required for sulfatase activity/Leucine-rich repeat (LRR) protein